MKLKDWFKKINSQYWKMITDAQIKAEYKEYLSTEDKESSPHNAHMFAIEKTKDGDYRGYSRRELIILVAGELPDHYD